MKRNQARDSTEELQINFCKFSDWYWLISVCLAVEKGSCGAIHKSWLLTFKGCCWCSPGVGLGHFQISAVAFKDTKSLLLDQQIQRQNWSVQELSLIDNLMREDWRSPLATVFIPKQQECLLTGTKISSLNHNLKTCQLQVFKKIHKSQKR